MVNTKRRGMYHPRAAVEAQEWDGTVSGATEIVNWVRSFNGTATYYEKKESRAAFIWLRMDNGSVSVLVGDVVIRDARGRFTRMSLSDFQEMYEPV